MGFFDGIKSFGNWVSSGFNKGVDQIKGVLAGGASVVGGAIGTVYNDLKSGASGIVNTYSGIINKGLDLGSHVVDKTAGTISDVGQSLSLPLLVLGGVVAVGAVIYLSKSR